MGFYKCIFNPVNIFEGMEGCGFDGRFLGKVSSDIDLQGFQNVINKDGFFDPSYKG